MATLKKIRNAQWPLVAEFVCNPAVDLMATVVGNVIGGASPPTSPAPTVQAIGGFYAGVAQIYEICGLPPNAVVMGGDINVETAIVGPTVSTVSVGDSAGATRFASAVSLLSSARTALTLTPFRGSGNDVRITITNTVAVVSAGAFSIRIFYIITGRANENQIT